MPRTYPPEAVREACSLYMSGLTCEEVARQMRQRGYARYSVETIRRWAKERGWEDERAKQAAEEAALAAALDADRLAAEILSGLVRMRAELQAKRTNGEVDFAEAVRLQLAVDSQIRQLMAQQRGKLERVDKPALALEVLELIVETLADEDPVALETLTPHLETLGARLKERYAEAA